MPQIILPLTAGSKTLIQRARIGDTSIFADRTVSIVSDQPTIAYFVRVPQAPGKKLAGQSPDVQKTRAKVEIPFPRVINSVAVASSRAVIDITVTMSKDLSDAEKVLVNDWLAKTAVHSLLTDGVRYAQDIT